MEFANPAKAEPTGASGKERPREQTLTAHEFELIRQLMKSRLEQNSELEFEAFDGYQYPSRTKFSMLNKPALSIRINEMCFNTACVRLFDGIQHIVPIVHPERKRLAIIPHAEEESASVEWARQKNDRWVSKTITAPDFLSDLYAMLAWDKSARYKVLGRLAASESGLIMVFDLTDAALYDTREVIDKATGMVRKRQIKYYPDEYEGKIGRSYNDYRKTRQMSLFEDVEEYAEARPAIPPQTNPAAASNRAYEQTRIESKETRET